MPRILAPYKTRFLKTSGRCTGAKLYLSTKTVKGLAQKYCSDYGNLIRPKICEIVLGGKYSPINSFLPHSPTEGPPTSFYLLLAPPLLPFGCNHKSAVDSYPRGACISYRTVSYQLSFLSMATELLSNFFILIFSLLPATDTYFCNKQSVVHLLYHNVCIPAYSPQDTSQQNSYTSVA
jgi:hypothetical protein